MPKQWHPKQTYHVNEYGSLPHFDPVTAVHAIVENSIGEILILEHTAKGFGLPGGHVELGETPDNAIIRELKEEVGIYVQMVTPWYLVITDRFNYDAGILIYLVSMPISQIPVPDEKEVASTIWCTRSEYLNSYTDRTFTDNVLMHLLKK